jgi:hypothetical protein
VALFIGRRGKRRDGVSHGPTARRVTHGAAAACAARGADVAAGQQCRYEVVVAAAQLAHTREASDRVPFKRPLSLTGGPGIFFIYQDF